MKGVHGLMVITSCQCLSGILRSIYQTTDGWLKGDCSLWRRNSKRMKSFKQIILPSCTISSEKDIPQNQLVYKHQVFGIFPSWCIPPHKPGKMRVVFDCSSEFQWRSLNKELLTGPDLTNQIVGVLSSFRENKIALMADIESLFYQVPVWEEDRRFLVFLWWKDGKCKNPVIDCEINVHVFGATSSPGCSHYALKKRSLDYKDVRGSKASETLHRNLNSKIWRRSSRVGEICQTNV